MSLFIEKVLHWPVILHWKTHSTWSCSGLMRPLWSKLYCKSKHHFSFSKTYLIISRAKGIWASCSFFSNYSKCQQAKSSRTKGFFMTKPSLKWHSIIYPTNYFKKTKTTKYQSNWKATKYKPKIVTAMNTKILQTHGLVCFQFHLFKWKVKTYSNVICFLFRTRHQSHLPKWR